MLKVPVLNRLHEVRGHEDDASELDVLADYVVVMVAQHKPRTEVTKELAEFLDTEQEAAEFVDWVEDTKANIMAQIRGMGLEHVKALVDALTLPAATASSSPEVKQEEGPEGQGTPAAGDQALDDQEERQRLLEEEQLRERERQELLRQYELQQQSDFERQQRLQQQELERQREEMRQQQQLQQEQLMASSRTPRVQLTPAPGAEAANEKRPFTVVKPGLVLQPSPDFVADDTDRAIWRGLTGAAAGPSGGVALLSGSGPHAAGSSLRHATAQAAAPKAMVLLDKATESLKVILGKLADKDLDDDKRENYQNMVQKIHNTIEKLQPTIGRR